MIKNKRNLLEGRRFKEAREDVLEILEVGIKVSLPKSFMKNSVRIEGDFLIVKNKKFELKKYRNIYVVGFGKASGAMARELDKILGKSVAKGIVVVKDGRRERYGRIEIVPGDHPVPSLRNVRATQRIIRLVENAGPNDLVICLISGGGSALLCAPADGITLTDMTKLNELLLLCGADIDEINTVRKHLSKVKGGNLAKAASPASLVSLVVSDVVGDKLQTIASGPTVGDKTTFKESVSILKKYGIWEKTPKRVRSRLEAGSKKKIPETPNPGDRIFKNVENMVVATNSLALKEMKKKAVELGYNTIVCKKYKKGNARVMPPKLLQEFKKLKKPACLISGGEYYCIVSEKGCGGPNHEFILSLVDELKGRRIVAAAIDSDGIDGSSKAAGAIADGESFERSAGRKMKAKGYLEKNDSCSFFRKMNDAILTGQTGTNVNDLRVLLSG